MQFKFFTIPVFSPEVLEAELNSFLRGHRILTVRRELVMDGQQSVWACCVEYLEGEGQSTLAAGGSASGRGEKVDYMKILSPEEFTIFRAMREVRKSIAEADGIPAYAIMIDEQLAKLAKLPAVDEAALKGLDGFGEKKYERFGIRFLTMLQKKKDETGK